MLRAVRADAMIPAGRPARGLAMASKTAELYEEDFFAWTRDQAAALRRMAEQRWNGPLDLEHLAEEIEDVGSERRDAVRSQVRRIIEHLLKLEHARARDPRGGWKDSVDDARAEIEDKLTRTIRRDVVDELPRLYERARYKAARGLRDNGEAQDAASLPVTNPYPLDDLLRHGWYPANRHGLADDLD
jgi:DNA-binding PucR family transcriptional regulator